MKIPLVSDLYLKLAIIIFSEVVKNREIIR